MQKRLMVERIFPLERFGNVHITNEVVLDGEVEQHENVEELYDQMVREVYQAGLNHHALIKETKLVETVEEKREVLYGERDA